MSCSLTHMPEEKAPLNYANWGCGTLFLTAIASTAFGFELVGKVCIFGIFAQCLVQALHRRQYEWGWGQHQLSREKAPAKFWSLVAINAVLMVASLNSLFDEFQRGTV
jgi:hypothetical protein